MRLRQVALVAHDLESSVADFRAVLGIDVAYRDPGVGVFGLHNAVMPVGDTFLEIVSPKQPDTTAGRYLDRRGGDGGYMVLVQCDDLDADRRRLASLGVRVVWSADLDDIRGTHLHPRDVGGAILSLDAAMPPDSWRWAGADWISKVKTDVVSAIVGVELQADDPERMAQRWSQVLDRRVHRSSSGAWVIALDQGLIRFVLAADGRGAGVGGFDVKAEDRNRIVEAAARHGLPTVADHVLICGTRVYFDAQD